MFSETLLKSLDVADWGYTEDSKPISYQEYLKWIQNNNFGPLTYMADERSEYRSDLTKIYPEFQSALVFLFSYQKTNQFLNSFYKNTFANGLKIASYTLGFGGEDYHFNIQERLEKIVYELKKNYPNINYKIALDIHPVLDRDLALKAGIGFFGKNSMLINTKSGSFTLIGSILLNQKIAISSKAIETDHCGQCTRCIDACPTDAIVENQRTINASRCISTFTIEQFKLETVPDKMMNLDSGFIFGCDICQDVCPWNKRIIRQNPIINYEWNDKQKEILDFFLIDKPENIINRLKQMSNREFREKFFKTSFFRSGKRGILKNFNFYLKSKN